MNPTTKTCSRCKCELLLHEFGNDKSRKDGKRRYCRACVCAYNSEWARKNPEKIRARDIRYWENNKEQYRKYQRDYAKRRRAEGATNYHEASRRFVERHRERIAREQRENARRNPARQREKARRRQARKRNAVYSVVDYKKILARDGYICHICSGFVRADDIHYDHVIPLARGGSHTEDNIKVSHSKCNVHKGTMLLGEYLNRLKDKRDDATYRTGQQTD